LKDEINKKKLIWKTCQRKKDGNKKLGLNLIGKKTHEE